MSRAREGTTSKRLRTPAVATLNHRRFPRELIKLELTFDTSTIQHVNVRCLVGRLCRTEEERGMETWELPYFF